MQTQTLNISLPTSLAVKTDEAVKKYGYSSRSEFFRALLRTFLVKDNYLNLEPFENIPLENIKTGLQNSGKYNQEFINSVMKGFVKSSVYAQD